MRALGVGTALGLGVATSAQAQSPPVPPPPIAEPSSPSSPGEPPPPSPLAASQRTWYSWQVVLVDSASLVLLLAGEGTRANAVADAAVAGYFLGGPVVHWSHGSVARGFGSLGLRVGIPVTGALVGALIGFAANPGNTSSAHCGGPICVTPAVAFGAVGFLLGLVAAPIVDAAALAYEDSPAPAPLAVATSLRLVPIATLPRDTAGHTAPGVGIAGTF